MILSNDLYQEKGVNLWLLLLVSQNHKKQQFWVTFLSMYWQHKLPPLLGLKDPFSSSTYFLFWVGAVV